MQEDKTGTVYCHAHTAEQGFFVTFQSTWSSFRTDKLRFKLMDKLTYGLCFKILGSTCTIFTDCCIVIIAGGHPSGSPSGQMSASEKHVIIDTGCTAQQ